MAGTLEGKIALVTGGGSGIGQATSLTFAREGAKVVVADVNADGGEETVTQIKVAGGDAFFVHADVSRASDVEAMVKTAVQTFGRLDCAFNNAGIAGGGTDDLRALSGERQRCSVAYARATARHQGDFSR